MKRNYHIKLPKEERGTLESVFRQLGVSPDFVSTMDANPEFSVHYIVELSKYELLYIRLACKTGYCTEIMKRTDHEEISHASTGVHAGN